MATLRAVHATGLASRPLTPRPPADWTHFTRFHRSDGYSNHEYHFRDQAALPALQPHQVGNRWIPDGEDPVLVLALALTISVINSGLAAVRAAKPPNWTY
jgi:hypothetical protein